MDSEKPQGNRHCSQNPFTEYYQKFVFQDCNFTKADKRLYNFKSGACKNSGKKRKLFFGG